MRLTDYDRRNSKVNVKVCATYDNEKSNITVQFFDKRLCLGGGGTTGAGEAESPRRGGAGLNFAELLWNC